MQLLGALRPLRSFLPSVGDLRSGVVFGRAQRRGRSEFALLWGKQRDVLRPRAGPGWLTMLGVVLGYGSLCRHARFDEFTVRGKADRQDVIGLSLCRAVRCWHVQPGASRNEGRSAGGAAI